MGRPPVPCTCGWTAPHLPVLIYAAWIRPSSPAANIGRLGSGRSRLPGRQAGRTAPAALQVTTVCGRRAAARAGLPGSRRRRPSAATPPTPTGKPFPQGENVAAPTAADLFCSEQGCRGSLRRGHGPKQVRTTLIIRSYPSKAPTPPLPSGYPGAARNLLVKRVTVILVALAAGVIYADSTPIPISRWATSSCPTCRWGSRFRPTTRCGDSAWKGR